MDPRESPSEEILTAARNLRAHTVAIEVVSAFTTAGVKSILLKGPSFARWLYDSPHERPYLDIDLLIAPDRVEAAERVLRSHGFDPDPLEIPHDMPWHAHTWTRASDGAMIDLHRFIVGTEVSSETGWTILSAQIEPINVAGRTLIGLDREARLVHVALHAAQHGSRLVRPGRDLDRALEREQSETWARARDLADRLHAISAFARGLRLSEAGAKLATRLELPTSAPLDVAARAADASYEGVALAWWLSRSRGVGRLRFVGRKLFPPASFMRAWSPLAGRSNAGLVIAYLWRVAWVVGRIPRAVIDVARVRLRRGK